LRGARAALSVSGDAELEEEGDFCDLDGNCGPMNDGVATVNEKDVSADLLRSVSVTGADGIQVELGQKMGTGKSVVVFLRHLG
jgi:hypothetical protein